MKITDAMVEASARARCIRDGCLPDQPVHHESFSDGTKCWRSPIKADLLGTKRRDGSIIEQWPTTPYWRWMYEHGARADLEAAAAVIGDQGEAT